MGKYYNSYLPTTLLSRLEYSSIDRVSKITSPTLFIHSKHDEIIPYKYSKKLFSEALKGMTTPKFFLETIGNHNEGFLLSGEKYTAGLDRFITGIVKQ
jgi:uncharacterized protein